MAFVRNTQHQLLLLLHSESSRGQVKSACTSHKPRPLHTDSYGIIALPQLERSLLKLLSQLSLPAWRVVAVLDEARLSRLVGYIPQGLATPRMGVA